MVFIKMLVARIVALVTRYPWAIAIFGFGSGLASFFLVEREQEKFAQMVSALMLLSWVWLALESLLQRGVLSWFGVKLPPPLLSFATQLVHQESLFFVIPFFFVTTSWNSGQMVFTSLLIISAFVSIVDPVYYRWLAARRWLYFIFHGVTLFAVLLTALPIIIHLPTPKSYFLSLVIAILLTLPGVIRELPFNWIKRILIAFVLITLLGGIGFSVRSWIPPATLRLTEVAITDRIDDKSRSPQNELKTLSVEQLRAGLYAYTAISAPRGLNERIYHVWRLNGNEVDRIALDINGGREAGYRAWTHKMNFPPYPTGRWQIHVVTEANQVIGVLRFHVVKSAALEQEALIDSDQSPEIETGWQESEKASESSSEKESTDEVKQEEQSSEPTEYDEVIKEDEIIKDEEVIEEEPVIEQEQIIEEEPPVEKEQVIEAEPAIEEDQIIKQPTKQESRIEDPKIEEPKIEEPIKEQPATEQPTTEQPTTEQPTTEQSTTEQPTTEEIIIDEEVIDEKALEAQSE